MTQSIWMAYGDDKVTINPKMLNRHGIIAGATGTGKTVTLKVMIENLSMLGVPTFVTDIKGDVSGLASAGLNNNNVNERVERFNIEGFEYQGYPVSFWDVYGEKGIPVRTTITSFGAQILSKLMNLNDTQTSVLVIVFKIAQEKNIELVTLQDLKIILDWIGRNSETFEREYGRISTQTLSTIQRNVVYLEELGGNIFFGKPVLSLDDWLRTDNDGKGIVNILHSVKLVNQPMLYAMFLIWMMTELFNTLPEVGDLDKPKLVIFFDEAHLLFDDVPKVLVDQIERIVKLIRSKGVGIFFITQNPTDVSADVLSQLGNRIQHALRAYTPQEQKAIKATADAFRTNEKFETKEALMDLGTGEALISFLDEKGRPSIVERVFVLPPHSLMDAIDETERQHIIEKNPLNRIYKPVESVAIDLPEETVAKEEIGSKEKAKPKEKATPKPKTVRKRKTALEKSVDSAMNTIGREVGKSIIKGIQGLFKK